VCSAYEEAVPVFRQPYGSGETRIIGGKEAANGQFPYQAAISLDDYDFCGGSLISKNWILTAGHCVVIFEQWKVVLGAHNLRDSNESGRVTLTTTEAILHEEFDFSNLDNDVAVLQLPEDVHFSGTSFCFNSTRSFCVYEGLSPKRKKRSCLKTNRAVTSLACPGVISRLRPDRPPMVVLLIVRV